MRRFEPGPSGVGPNWATATVLFLTILSRPRCPMKYDDHSRFCYKHLQKGFAKGFAKKDLQKKWMHNGQLFGCKSVNI